MIERRDRAPAGHLHDVPGARSRRRHGGAVQDRGARRVRALPAAGDARRRVVHGRADPGRSGRPRARAGAADSRRAARAAGVPAEGELGRGRDVLPAGPRARGPGGAAARHAARRAPAGRGRAATCSGPRRSASAIATTCARSRSCSPRSASTCTWSRRWARRRPTSRACRDADFNVVLYPEIAGTRRRVARAHVRPAVHQDGPDRRRRDARLHRARSRALAGVDPAPALRRHAVARCRGTRARSTRRT